MTLSVISQALLDRSRARDSTDLSYRISSESELREFLFNTWKVSIPDVQVCEHHSTPWRAFCDAYYARSPVSIWKASRGFGGKTFLLALLSLTEAITLGADVNLLGGSGQQSINVHQYMEGWWNLPTAPRSLLLNTPGGIKTKLRSGNCIEALMASQKSVRGGHPPRLRCDEIDEMDLGILEAAQGQPMSKNGVQKQTVMSSTQQYADGTMSKMLQRASERGWSVHEWCYRESMEPHGWLSAAEVASKKTEITTAMWDAEYEGQEPNPEDRAIITEKVKEMFRRELGEFRGAVGEYIEIEEPVPGAQYGTGADWARKKDFTVIETWRYDVTPIRLVAFLRINRCPWPLMVSKFDERMKRFPGNASHDGTGVGDVVDGYMEADAEPFQMVGKARADLLTNYVAAIERGELEAPYIEFMRGEHLYASQDDLYGRAKKDHLPDSICAGALGYRALRLPPKKKPWWDQIADGEHEKAQPEVAEA